MEFLKIQITKQRTLNVTYKNENGDIVQLAGANLVHKDLRHAMNALIPHLAIITEQREAMSRNLKQVQSDRITDEGDNSVYKRLDVDTVTFSECEQVASISGCRILLSRGVIKLATPEVSLADNEQYQYNDDLSLDLDAVKYEAKAYIEEKKWGAKQAEIDFRDINPFDGVQPDEVPTVDEQPKPKKRGRKPKAA